MESILLYGLSVSLLTFSLVAILYLCKIKAQVINLNKQLSVEFKKINHYLTVLTKNEGDRLVNDFKIYVGNVDYSTSEAELQNLFEQYGLVAEVNIPRDKRTGRTRGYGFITYNDTSDAVKALELDGASFKERTIQVSFAKERN
jgi:RNA recognition motif-containing protein